MRVVAAVVERRRKVFAVDGGTGVVRAAPEARLNLIVVVGARRLFGSAGARLKHATVVAARRHTRSVASFSS